MKFNLGGIFRDDALLRSCFNLALAWFAGQFLTAVFFKFGGIDLNCYNSIEHISIGIFLGTFVYLKSGRKLRGVLMGLIAVTLFNVCWEVLENQFRIYGRQDSIVDTLTDIFVVYTGSIFGFVIEEIKKNL